jgi:HAD superfamily hydrolase (TIGR01509 family)
MVKAILFDLDGTLVESKGSIHFETLNQALVNIAGPQFEISKQDHLSFFDGKQTKEKLKILTEKNGLLEKQHQDIWNEKQRLTKEILLKIQKNEKMIQIFQDLKLLGLKIACCSNAVRETIEISLDKLGILRYFDLIVSNQDVISGKPHPEIFWRAMIEFKVLPEECLIIEDAPPGILAAKRTGARVMRVKDSNSYGLKEIKEKINMEKIESVKWVNDKLNVLVLMAGQGSRFASHGYSLIKPLISINGEPMIKKVIDSLDIEANFIFVVQKEHRKKYSLDTFLNTIAPNCQIVEVDGLTEGAACSALTAKNLINNENNLLIVNSDQIIKYDALAFFYQMQEQDLDGGVLTFENYSPKYSYLITDEFGHITKVAEKEVISNRATVGVYFWKKGQEFVEAAEKMIRLGKRVKNEFYVFPVTEEAIEKGLKMKEFPVDEMWGVGTPEDLEEYLRHHTL